MTPPGIRLSLGQGHLQILNLFRTSSQAHFSSMGGIPAHGALAWRTAGRFPMTGKWQQFIPGLAHFLLEQRWIYRLPTCAMRLRPAIITALRGEFPARFRDRERSFLRAINGYLALNCQEWTN